MCISLVCRLVRLNLVLLRPHTPVTCSHAFCSSYTRLLHQSTRQCTHIHPFHVLYVNFIITHVKVRTITVNMNNLTNSYVLEDYLDEEYVPQTKSDVLEDYFDEEYVPHHRFAPFCASSDVKYRYIDPTAYSLY